MRSAIVQVAVVQMYHSVTYECCHGCQISVLRLSLHQCELALKEALSKVQGMRGWGMRGWGMRGWGMSPA